jgi:hypothetical protein
VAADDVICADGADIASDPLAHTIPDSDVPHSAECSVVFMVIPGAQSPEWKLESLRCMIMHAHIPEIRWNAAFPLCGLPAAER